MTPDCNYVLDNNTPCRCPALHGDRFCRHHTPEALARRQRATTKSPASNPEAHAPEDDPWLQRAYWRKLHRWTAAEGELESLHESMDMILNALADQQISARSGGSLLAAMVRRKAELQLKAKDEHIRALLEQASLALRAQRQAGFEALS
jgi:hypothetical protein